MSETIAEIRARASEASKADPAYLKAVIGIKAAKAFEDRATLLRALDEAQQRAERAEVKPLEWSIYNHARGVAGEYQWSEWLPAGYRAVFFATGEQCGESIGEMHPSQDAAKAACQQHHNERVMGLLVPCAAQTLKERKDV